MKCRERSRRLLAGIFVVQAALIVDAVFLQHREVFNVKPISALDESKLQDPYALYDGKCLLKLSVCNQSAASVALKSLDHTDCSFLNEQGSLQLPTTGCAVEYVICSPKTANKLAGPLNASSSNKSQAPLFSGVDVSIWNKDAGALFRKIGGTAHGWNSNAVHAGDFYSAYRDLDAIENRVAEAVYSSGGLAKLEELSPKTYEGRSIKAVRIRDPSWSTGRPRVVLTFQIHAREWIAGMSGCYAVEHLIKAVNQGELNLRGMEVILVPISNPDGFVHSISVDRFWRKNRRPNKDCEMDPDKFDVCNGVDLNRNFEPPGKDHTWASGNACCRQTYTGPSSLSEPESQALAKLIEEAPTSVHIDVHSYGQWVMAPYSFKDRQDDLQKTLRVERPNMDELGMAMENSIEKVHGEKYTYGIAADQGKGTADGIFADWSTGKGALGFMYELRPKAWDFAPPADQILPSAEESIQGIYTAIHWAQNHR